MRHRNITACDVSQAQIARDRATPFARTRSYLLRPRRERTALRHAHCARTHVPAPPLHRGRQPALHMEQHPALIAVMPQCLEQKGVIDFIEQRADVVLQHPVIPPAALTGDSQGVMRRFARSITIGVGVKHRLEQRLQHHGHRRLSDPVAHGGHTQYPRPTGFLRDRHGFHRRREVAPRRQPIPDPVEVAIALLIERLDRDRINPRRSLVGLHTPGCLPHQALGNRKRFRHHQRLILRQELTTNVTGTTRPLCSTPITDASTLVRIGPSSDRTSVLSASLFFTWQAPFASRSEFPQFR